MDNRKFTKGKWELKDCTIRNPAREEKSGNIFDIAQCYAGFDLDRTGEECRANALLISKAPEMLEMLIELREIFDKYRVDNEQQFSKYKHPLEQLIKEATTLNTNENGI